MQAKVIKDITYENIYINGCRVTTEKCNCEDDCNYIMITHIQGIGHVNLTAPKNAIEYIHNKKDHFPNWF